MKSKCKFLRTLRYILLAVFIASATVRGLQCATFPMGLSGDTGDIEYTAINIY